MIKTATMVAILATISTAAMAQGGYITTYPNGVQNFTVEHGSPLSGGYSESFTAVPLGSANGTTVYSNGMVCNQMQMVANCTR